MKRRLFFLLAVLAWLSASAPVGAVPLTLPDSSQTTTVSAEVVEQSEILVPAIINFDVTDISQSTASTAVTVQFTNIVLSSSNKHITVSVQGGGQSFSPPGPATPTWSASDVSWNNATWSNGTGTAGTLSATIFQTVATSAADAPSLTTNNLVFTLAPNPSVRRAGSHSLNLTWKVESLGL